MLHEEQIDLRIRRTHRFWQEVIIELIPEKGFEAITVGDIAERAMINRVTFALSPRQTMCSRKRGRMYLRMSIEK